MTGATVASAAQDVRVPRVFVLDRIDPVPLVTLLRMYQEAGRGFTVSAIDVLRVLEAVRRTSRVNLDADVIRRESGGVVLADGAAAPSAVPACVRRSLREFPRARALVESLGEALEHEGVRGLAYHVYGGFARACVTGEAFADVDVAAATAADRHALLRLRGRRLRLRNAEGRAVTTQLDVRRRVVPSPAGLVSGIELVMARIAYSTTDDCFHMDPECLDAIEANVMWVRPLASLTATPARTIVRTLKYAARGGRVPLSTLMSLVEAYRTAPAVARWSERGLRRFLRLRELATGG